MNFFLRVLFLLAVLLVSPPTRADAAGPDESNRYIIAHEVAPLLHALGGDDLRTFFGFVPAIELAPGQMPNAFAKAPNRIEITHGLLEFTASQEELAFVLAHELAHHMLGHSVAYPGFASSSPVQQAPVIRWEHEADALAVNLLSNAGFDSKAGAELLTRLAHHFDELIPGSSTQKLLVSRAGRIQHASTIRQTVQ